MSKELHVLVYRLLLRTCVHVCANTGLHSRFTPFHIRVVEKGKYIVFVQSYPGATKSLVHVRMITCYVITTIIRDER